MPLPRRALLGASMLGAGLALPALQARAQAWPNRPIRIIVPSVTGGFDNYARMKTPRLSEILGVPVVVENKPGANGNVGMQEVQRAAPDGHTILFAAIGSLSINVSVYRGMPLDPVEDLAAVACPVTSPMVWVANPESGPRSLGELVERARAAPGKLDYALPSAGTINHLIVEGFKLRHGLDIPAGALSRHAAGAAGRGGGAGAGHGGQPRRRLGAHQRRPAAGAGGDVARTLAAGARGADGDRAGAGRDGLRRLVCLHGAEGDAAGAGGEAERGDQPRGVEEAYVARLAEMGAGTQAMTPAAQLAFMLAERKKWGDIARAAKVEVV